MESMEISATDQPLLGRAERLFARGMVLEAEWLLRSLANQESADPLTLSDLGVVLSNRGATEEAAFHLLEALQHDGSSDAALKNLAALAELADDPVQAGHWWRRVLDSSPNDAEAKEGLQRLCAKGSDGVVTEPHTSGPAVGRDWQGLRVLLVVDFFYPSIGGTERLAEHTGVALTKLGMTVEVAARRLATRNVSEVNGMRIHEIGDDREHDLAQVLREGHFDAILVQSDPTSWPAMVAPTLVDQDARTVVVPCINAENFAIMAGNPAVRSAVLDRLRRADAVGVSSLSGFDQRFARDNGLSSVYVPNATPGLEPTPGFRSRHGLREDVPLLLCVGNEWAVKNHIGLLEALHEDDGSWQLAVIGSPAEHEPHVAARVRELAAHDPRVLILGGLPPDEVADAMLASNILLLPSLAEATPMVILEAMSCRLPWIATPQCGAVHDHAGGLIVPVAQFGDAVDFLLTQPEACEMLGSAGMRHWQTAYTWEVVGRRYAALLAGEDLHVPDWPADILGTTDAVRSRFYESQAVRSTLRRREHRRRTEQYLPKLSCVVLCGGRINASEAIESVLEQDYPADRLEVLAVAGDRPPVPMDRVRVVTGCDDDSEGLAAALASATGELIAVCDGLDRWFPDLARTQAGLFRRSDSVTMAYADMQVIDDAGAFTGSSLLADNAPSPRESTSVDQLLQFRFAARSTLVVRRATVPDLPGDIPFPLDWIAVQAASRGEVAFTRRPLAQLRTRPAGIEHPTAVVKSVRDELWQCRRTLISGVAGSMTTSALVRTALTLEARATRAFQACGTFLISLIEVDSLNREAAVQLVENATTNPDGEAMLRNYAMALVHDPFNLDARLALTARLSG